MCNSVGTVQYTVLYKILFCNSKKTQKSYWYNINIWTMKHIHDLIIVYENEKNNGKKS